MRLPREPDDARAREGKASGWLAIGPAATLSLAGRPPLGRTVESLGGVHEALDALRLRSFGLLLVDAAVLAGRPRAALRALRARAGTGRLVVLAASPSVRVARAARALDVPCLQDLSEVAELGPATPARTRTKHPTEPVLPRADRGEGQAPALDVGRFAEGCLARLERPGALVSYLLRTLAEASDAARVSLMLSVASGRSLVLRAGRGIDPALLGKVRVPLGSGVAGRAAALGRPVTGHGSAGGARGYGGQAYVVLPLGREGACEGVLSLTGFPHDRLPPTPAIQRWVRLVQRAGQALRSARRLKRAETRSARDALTGLPNRRAFERALAREWERARRAQRGLGIAILDVDRFKVLNDGHGHDAGDVALVEVARRLEGALRDTDLVARWGGEEFALLLPDLNPGSEAEALLAVERVRRAVSARPIALGLGRPSVPVTISGGVAVGPGDAAAPALLVHAADQALLAAKQAGRDQVLPASGRSG